MSNPEPIPASTTGASPGIHLRAPTTTSCNTTAAAATATPSFTPPSIPWLSGTWHVTHSTLPMWKKARNVAITYAPLASDPTRLSDVVTYQSLTSPKLKTVSGVDTPAAGGAWNWRGSGWLVIANSHWEVLGYGGGEEEGEEGWVVTFFEKTLFTPRGLDVYSRRKEGLSEGLLEGIKEALARVEAESVRKLAGELFMVKSD